MTKYLSWHNLTLLVITIVFILYVLIIFINSTILNLTYFDRTFVCIFKIEHQRAPLKNEIENLYFSIFRKIRCYHLEVNEV